LFIWGDIYRHLDQSNDWTTALNQKHHLGEVKWLRWPPPPPHLQVFSPLTELPAVLQQRAEPDWSDMGAQSRCSLLPGRGWSGCPQRTSAQAGENPEA